MTVVIEDIIHCAMQDLHRHADISILRDDPAQSLPKSGDLKHLMAEKTFTQGHLRPKMLDVTIWHGLWVK